MAEFDVPTNTSLSQLRLLLSPSACTQASILDLSVLGQTGDGAAARGVQEGSTSSPCSPSVWPPPQTALAPSPPAPPPSTAVGSTETDRMTQCEHWSVFLAVSRAVSVIQGTTDTLVGDPGDPGKREVTGHCEACGGPRLRPGGGEYAWTPPAHPCLVPAPPEVLVQ